MYIISYNKTDYENEDDFGWRSLMKFYINRKKMRSIYGVMAVFFVVSGCFLTGNKSYATEVSTESYKPQEESIDTEDAKESAGLAEEGALEAIEPQAETLIDTEEPEEVGDVSGYYEALRQKGFPDSYCAKLAPLQERYPGWDFRAVQTGLDFQMAVAAESTPGKNLVQSKSNDARKSMDTAAYDWTSNTWYGYDGNSWVCASDAYIAYCMDPRNFLDETHIFQFESLNYQTYQNVEGTQNILNNTFMAGNYVDTDSAQRNYPNDFVTIGSGLGISPYHLAARCKQEQGTQGTSQLISGTYAGYEGYFNYFNIGAYTTSNASAVQNGLNYAKNAGWNTRYKSIQGGSQILHNNYVAKGQNTLYFQKFNVVYTPSLYAHQYMTNVQAAISESVSMSKAYRNKSQSFVFYIPVYQNMPESPVAFSDSGNGNNWLSGLAVEGYSLTPSFRGDVTDYSLVVGQKVGSVNISAAAVVGTSTVSGNGSHGLNYGTNVIEVTCKAQNGSTKTYKISIVRKQPSGVATDVVENASVETNYQLGDTYMTGVQPGETEQDILSKITFKNCEGILLNADRSHHEGPVATGNILAIFQNGVPVKTYEVILYGDLNGDGKLNNTDLVLMKKHILEVSPLSGDFLVAADLNKAGDGVTNRDMVLLKKHILSIESISQ